MQLRTMTLQAIGPFAGRHTVDFASLSASGLFLLEGPTGAGKSTLIDAVVFALYGKVASDDTSDDRLRSAFAGEETESFVDLTFEVGSGIYRVQRTPAYDRAKKRGSGTVRQQASVRLWRVSPDDLAGDVPASDPVTRLDEAGLEIERAVGLSRAQFVQTIVLPQGEFSKFLRAKPEDRRGLLQKIFGTEIYDRMQRRLMDLRAQVVKDLEVARTAVENATAQLMGAARLDEDEAAALQQRVAQLTGPTGHGAGGPDVTTLASEITARTEVLALQAEADRVVASEAEALYGAAAAALEEQTRVARLVERRTRLRREQDALGEGAAAHAEGVARLERGRAAAAVRPLLQACVRALADVGTARKTVLAAADAAPEAVAGVVGRLTEVLAEGGGPASRLGIAGDPRADDAPRTDDAAHTEDAASVRRRLVTLRDSGRHDASALDHVVATEAALNAGRRAVRDGRDLADTLRQQIAADDAWLAGRPAQREALATRLAGQAATAARLEAYQARATELDAAASAHLALGAMEVDAQKAVTARDDAARSAAEAVAREAAVRTARIAGMAGVLAQSLVDGDPCPVCGSADHPAKASVGDDHVTAERLAEVEQERVAAERVLGRAGEAVAALAARVEAAREALGDSSAEQVQADTAATNALLDECRTALGQVQALTAEIEAHAAATDLRSAGRQASDAQLTDVSARTDVLQQALDADEAEVAKARGSHPTVVARRSELLGLVESADDLVVALDGLAQAELDVHRRNVELDAALAEHGFATAEDATAAQLDRADLDQLAAAVSAYAGAVEAVRAALADSELAGLADDATADVAAARAAEQAARDVASAAGGRARLSQERAAAVESTGANVLAAASRLEEAWRSGGPVTRLAGLASGTGNDNARSLSLATYVLARRFEDVVAAANERLLGMSDGRYELVRSEQKEDVGARRTGLAMRVVDHWTDQQRDPRTLSGGESFYVSLCLALGLADVVTAEAGGIDLGTLFVDEGFGSLDPHALGQVLAELGKLRAGGRVVGVVSHVEALKSTIADRIEVRPGADGPSTLRVLAS